MQTYRGGQFHPIQPLPEEVFIEDIAHALSLLCRFGGHCKTFYSVGEHCLRVAAALPPELKLWGLLHDASEAYVIDMPRPLKHSGWMETYREIEGQVQQAICARFGLRWPEPPEVKRIDNLLLNTEARDLMAPLHSEWTHREPSLRQRIIPLASPEVEARYLRAFARYGGKR
jgi:hypothetical protein